MSRKYCKIPRKNFLYISEIFSTVLLQFLFLVIRNEIRKNMIPTLLFYEKCCNILLTVGTLMRVFRLRAC